MLLDSRFRFAGGAGVDSLLEGAVVGSAFVDSSCDFAFAFSFPLLAKKSLAFDGCDLDSGFLEDDDDLEASWTSLGLDFAVAGLVGTDACVAAAIGGVLRVRRLTFGLGIIPYLWYVSRGSSDLASV